LKCFIYSIGDLTDFAKSKDDDGNDIFPDDEKLALCKKQTELIKVFYENGDFMFSAQYLEIPFRRMSYIYASRKDAENTFEAAASAAKYAIMFDTYDPNAVHTSNTERQCRRRDLVA